MNEEQGLFSQQNIVIGLVLLLVIVGIGFLIDWPIENPSLFQSSSKCYTPCWMGIIPGQSTEAEVEKVLQNNPERFRDLTCNEHQCFWQDAGENFWGRAKIQDEIVQYMEFQVASPEAFEEQYSDNVRTVPAHIPPVKPFNDQANFTLEKIINQLGTPTSYFFRPMIGFDGPPFFWFIIFFEERHMVAVIKAIPDPIKMSEEECQTKISPNMFVGTFFFGDVETIAKSEFLLAPTDRKVWTDFDDLEPFPACWD